MDGHRFSAAASSAAPAASARPGRPWASFAALILFWGLSFAAIKIGLDYAPPLIYTGLRSLVSGVALASVALWRREPLDWRRGLPVFFVSALFNVLLSMGVQTIAMTHTTSGLMAVLVYFQPVVTGLLAWLWLGEPMTAAKGVGLVLGFFGVVAASSATWAGGTGGPWVAMGLFSAIAWATGTVYVKKVQHRVSPYWLVAGQFFIGGSVLTLAGTGVESWAAIAWTPMFFAALFYSGLVALGLAWIVWLRLLARNQASQVASVIFAVPVISVVVGVLFLHEPFTLNLLVGLVAVAGGIWLANRPQEAPARPGAGRSRPAGRPVSTRRDV
ncbi:MAG: DMT family transporter [Actinomycetia bacterium]|nr:DMT family transporter [Actinomycetes bacterium]